MNIGGAAALDDRSAWKAIAFRLAAGLVIVFVLLGALLPQRGLFVVLPADGPIRSLPVTVIDGTGIVMSVAGASVDSGPVSVSAVPGRPNAIVYQWDGGACDRATTITVGRQDGSIRLSRVTEFRHGGSGCTLEAIGRSVVLEFREPIDASSIVVAPDHP